MRYWITLFWLADIVVLSLGLAIFEILLERQYGWGGRLNTQGWGRRLFAGTFVSELAEKSYLTVYHVFTFVFVMPAILYAQFVLLKFLGVCQPVAGHLLMQVEGVRFAPFMCFLSIWFAILVVEDALWFALNWYYPESWKDLLAGNIWWHTRWVRLGRIKLPRFYLTTPLAAVALLLLSLSPR